MRVVVVPGCRLIGLYFEASWNELSYEAHRAWKRLFLSSPAIQKQIGDAFVRVSLWENDGLHGEFVGVTASPTVDIPQGLRSLEIPAAKFVYEPCLGTATAIRDTFGTMYAWARQRALRTDEYRIDSGYAPDEPTTRAESHDLYVRLTRQNLERSSTQPAAA